MNLGSRGPVVTDTGVFGARLGPSGRLLAALYRPMLEGRPAAISFVTVAELEYGAQANAGLLGDVELGQGERFMLWRGLCRGCPKLRRTNKIGKVACLSSYALSGPNGTTLHSRSGS